MLLHDVSPAHYGRHQVYVFDDQPALQSATAEYLCGICLQHAAQQDTVSFALSGGSTPIGVYERLAQPPWRERFPWENTHILFGDERYVPHDDEQSNYRMASQAMLQHVPLNAQQIHAIPTHCAEPADCAALYESEIKQLHVDSELPAIDVVLLGMGDDGHTASLFPDTPILSETRHLVAAVFVAKFNSWRISLTYPVLNHAKTVCVLVSGEGKAEVLREVISSDTPRYPIQRIANPNGIVWLTDRAAASRLP